MTEAGAIVLGGGLSRRYGRDKLTAPWSDTTLFERVRAALPERRTETLLVLRHEQDPVEGVDRVVRDDPRLPDGPLRGLVAGLRAARSGWNWVLACDLPQVRTAMLELLAESADDGVDAVVFRHGEHAEPLVALYHRRCLPEFEAALANGDPSPRRALARVRVRWIADDLWRAVDPDGDTFLNVNTPDLARRAAGTEEPR